MNSSKTDCGKNRKGNPEREKMTEFVMGTLSLQLWQYGKQMN
jgi:hypothetical protein